MGKPSRGGSRYQSDRQNGGSPERFVTPKLFELRVGKWMRVVYNGRFSAEYRWWYRKMVVNVGLFDVPIGSLFARGEPKYRDPAAAYLW